MHMFIRRYKYLDGVQRLVVRLLQLLHVLLSSGGVGGAVIARAEQTAPQVPVVQPQRLQLSIRHLPQVRATGIGLHKCMYNYR